jgi:hypothetical protein
MVHEETLYLAVPGLLVAEAPKVAIVYPLILQIYRPYHSSFFKGGYFTAYQLKNSISGIGSSINQ